jgi:nucleoside-diphosphate-sugar epimerase
VNVGGLKNVLEAVRETETIQKVIYTSSFFALGPTDDGYVADENQVGTYFAFVDFVVLAKQSYLYYFLLRITEIVM